jgi:hypothetical protein
VLTIKLADDSTISGKVDSTTEIECRTPRANDDGTTHERHGADDGPNHDVGDDHGDDGGEDHSGPGRGGDDERACTTADLTPGTAVHEAELHGSGDSAVFEEIKLLK